MSVSLYIRLVVLLSFWTGWSSECMSGRGYGRRRTQTLQTPLIYKQHVPQVPETSLGASGQLEGRIARKSARFRELVVNNNPDIIFKDDEGTGVDRIMSQRCKDRLNTLSILVMNQWPGVRLRVIDAWEEQLFPYTGETLYHEGRAVDVTTSDSDRLKLGMLARLAVNAGFDWVCYSSKSHIHCSVKSDHSIAIRTGGCFSGSDLTTMENGSHVPMSRLSIGDRVQSFDPTSGRVHSDRILTFLHRDVRATASFVAITTEDGRRLTLTADHLILTSPHPLVSASVGDLTEHLKFAASVQIEEFVFVTNKTGDNSMSLWPVRVVQLSYGHLANGLFSPMTSQGTILVGGIAVSCYSQVRSHSLAHAAMAPLRYVLSASNKDTVSSTTDHAVDGVHWYPYFLQQMSRYFLPRDWLFGQP